MKASAKETSSNWVLRLAIAVTILGNLSCAQSGSSPHEPAVPAVTSQLQGGQDAGGGDVLKSTRNEVDSAIANVRRDARSFLSAVQTQVERGTFRSQDAELNKVLTKFFGPRAQEISQSDGIYLYPVAELIGHLTKMTWTDSATCRDSEGHVHDASTEHYTNAQICFNEAALRRLSPDSLKEEVLALYFHELTHQMGFGESAALKVQSFIREKQKSMYFVSNVRNLALAALEAKSSQDRCFIAGQIQGELSGWRGRVVDISFESLTSEAKRSRWYAALGEGLRPNNTARAGSVLAAVGPELCARPFESRQDQRAFLELVNHTLDAI